MRTPSSGPGERYDVFLSHNSADKDAAVELYEELEQHGLRPWMAVKDALPGRPWLAQLEEILTTIPAVAVLVGASGIGPWEEREMEAAISEFVDRSASVIPVLLGGAPEKPKLPLLLKGFVWVDLREQSLDRLVAGIKAARPQPQPRKPARRTRSRDSARIYILTVELERDGDALSVRYSLPGTEPFSSTSLPWDDVAPRIQALHAAVDAGRLPTSEESAVLFDVLFGDENRWRPLLRVLFGRPEPEVQPTPVYGSVRLRVRTVDEALLGLPWRLTAWNDTRLVERRWTFTETPDVDPTADYATATPANVLVVAGEGPTGDSGLHVEAVRDVLVKLWGEREKAGYVRVAGDERQLENALAGMNPHVVYVYGRSAEDGLRFGGGVLVWSRLAELVGTTAARVVYLNATGDLTAAGAAFDTLPLVVRRGLPEWTADATKIVLGWLDTWLGKGIDPVDAFHEVLREDGSGEASSLVIRSAYRTWKTTPYRAPAPKRPLQRLDREEQKALVAKRVAELVRSDSRRVLGLVAYAAPGNAVESLVGQLRDHLELELAERAATRWLHLSFPESPKDLRRNLEEELKLQLEADRDEPVPHLLRRRAPKAEGSRRRIVWIDWGTFGDDGRHQDPLSHDGLSEWLRFSSEFLGLRCPDDLRVISSLALELPEKEHARLAEVLQENRRQAWCRRPEFRLSPLPPLGKVSEEDLFDFLDDANNSTCPPAVQAEVAELLAAKTGGDFEQTVALIDRAERTSWYDLLDELRR